MGSGLARVRLFVLLLGSESGDAGPEHRDVVPEEEHFHPLAQVALHHPVLDVRGAGELESQAADHLFFL